MQSKGEQSLTRANQNSNVSQLVASLRLCAVENRIKHVSLSGFSQGQSPSAAAAAAAVQESERNKSGTSSLFEVAGVKKRRSAAKRERSCVVL